MQSIIRAFLLLWAVMLVACGAPAPTAAPQVQPTQTPYIITATPEQSAARPTQAPSPTAPPATDTPPDDDETTLVIGGDVIEYRYGATEPIYRGLAHDFQGVIPLMRRADVVLFNAEGGLCNPLEAGYAPTSIYNFYLTTEGILDLKAQIPEQTLILGQANNHTMNFGEECRRLGTQTLREAGIHVVGAGQNIEEARTPYSTQHGSTNLVILSYASTLIIPDKYVAQREQAGIVPMNTTYLRQDLAAVPEDSFVIVVMHAAFEFQPEPADSEVDFARAAVAWGADMVVGHGSHVTQTPRIIDGVPVFYSLGNALMDQCISNVVMSTYWLDVTLRDNKLVDVVQRPYHSEQCMLPQPLNGEWTP